MSEVVLSLDIGTTAVKAALVLVEAWPTARVLASASVDTHAYERRRALSPVLERGEAIQDVLSILQAVNSCARQLSTHESAAHVSRVCACDQMHGCMAWRCTDGTVQFSDLVTWEDMRPTDATCARVNAVAMRHGLPALHRGFGWLTLAYACEMGRPAASPGRGGLPLDVQPELEYGTVGAFVCKLFTPVSSAPVHTAVMEASDAASWGMHTSALLHAGTHADTENAADSGNDAPQSGWAIEALREVHPSLPAIAHTHTHTCACVGTLERTGGSERTRAWLHSVPELCDVVSLLQLSAAPCIRVHACAGDHPCALLGAAALARASLPRLGAAGRDVRDACVFLNVGTSAQIAALVDASSVPAACALPTGCEVRPFPRLRDTAPCVLIVGASMNGGKVLAHIAGALLADVQHIVPGQSADALLPAVYAHLEAGAAGLASVPELTELPFPERVPITQSGAAKRPNTMSLTSITADSLGSAAAVYAAAARAVVANLLHMLPEQIWAGCSRVVCGGGTVAKSAVLRTAVEHHLRLRAPGVTITMLSPDSAAHAGVVGAALAGCAAIS